jgi:type I restriction enzyme, S subunit
MRDSAVLRSDRIRPQWRVMRLKHLLTRIEQGWSPDCYAIPAGDDEWGVLRAGCCNGGRFHDADNKRLPPDLAPRIELEVQPGDVLMSRASGSSELIGSVALVPTEVRPKLLLSDKIYRLHVNRARVVPGFLAASLNSGVARSQIESIISGASGLAKNIAQADVGELKLAVPPLHEQRTIVEYLDRETVSLDALVGAKERLLDLLAEKRKTIIASAVTRGLDPNVKLRESGVPWIGEIPAHWDTCHLRRVIASMDYGTSQAVEPEGQVAVLRMGDLRDGELDFARTGYVDAVPDDLLLRPDDLLFNRTNSLDQIGKVAKFRGREFDVSFASYLVRLRVNERADSEFLNYLLNSPYVLAWARAEALPAIGQANLNPNRYSYIVVAIPPLEEQRTIVEHIARETAKLDAVRAATERTIALLRERRSALIAAAVTGQLDVGAAA